MADIGVKQNWLVSPDADIEKKWLEVQIQERKSRIVKVKQDIEDLMKAQKVKLEAQIMMLEKEIASLKEQMKTVTIDV